MRVHIIPALQDNYMYLLVDEASNEAAVVDPVEPEKVYSVANTYLGDYEEAVQCTLVVLWIH